MNLTASKWLIPLGLGGLLFWEVSPTSFVQISSDNTQFHPCILNTERFTLRWRHSVERQLWLEHYQQQDEQLHLYQSWLQTFGAGTSSTEGTLENVPAGYVGYRHNQRLNELNWTVSRRMEGSILWGEKLDTIWPVYQQLPDYSVIHIQAHVAPRILLLLRKTCYD